jgi:hypothetical protein
LVRGACDFGVGEGMAGFSLSLVLDVSSSGLGGRLWDVSDDTAFLPGVGELGGDHNCDQESLTKQSGHMPQ